jgi:hypothetical protein
VSNQPKLSESIVADGARTRTAGTFGLFFTAFAKTSATTSKVFASDRQYFTTARNDREAPSIKQHPAIVGNATSEAIGSFLATVTPFSRSKLDRSSGSLINSLSE